MEHYRERMKNYRNSVESEYRNANGNMGAAVQALDPTDRTLSITITPIDSTVAGIARIFGYNISPDETYNTANNMTVTVSESSHQEVKRQSSSNPFRIKGITYTVSSVLQLAQTFNIVRKSIAGASDSRVWQPQNYTSPQNYNSLMIKTSALQLVVDGPTYIDINFLAGANATMVLNISEKLDNAQMLSGKSPIKSAQ